MRIFLIILSSMIIMGASSCQHNYPTPPENIHSYIGESSEGGICRNNNENLMECIYSDDVNFNNYICYSLDDNETIETYVLELLQSCKKW